MERNWEANYNNTSKSTTISTRNLENTYQTNKVRKNWSILCCLWWNSPIFPSSLKLTYCKSKWWKNSFFIVSHWVSALDNLVPNVLKLVIGASTQVRKTFTWHLFDKPVLVRRPFLTIASNPTCFIRILTLFHSSGATTIKYLIPLCLGAQKAAGLKLRLTFLCFIFLSYPIKK